MRGVLLTWAAQLLGFVLVGSQLADTARAVSATGLPALMAGVLVLTAVLVTLTLLMVEPTYRTWATLALRGGLVPTTMAALTAWSVYSAHGELILALVAAGPWFAGGTLGVLLARWIPFGLAVPRRRRTR